jgi:hypothetical protein
LPRHAYRRTAAGVDDHAVERGQGLIPCQRVLPGLQFGVAHAGVDEIHLADVAFVLLERGDLLRVRRPAHDRTIASRPAGIVGGVAEVLDAVPGQLHFLAGRDVAYPEIPVANERGFFAVG